ncbi:MAG: carboxylating nicotinate-nucleotide diphosphorylase [Acidimicrobiales bacterium]
MAAVNYVAWDRILRLVLEEDIGVAGDITTDAIIPPGQRSEAVLVARERGRVAGLPVAERLFRTLSEEMVMSPLAVDGDDIEAGAELARFSGPARPLLTGERCALNAVALMSGWATAAAALVEEVSGYRAVVVPTRKGTGGWRALERYAVSIGGGGAHRFGLYDVILIKDNHIALAGGIREALRRAKARMGHLVKVEVEVSTLDELDEALDAGADAVLLDNMGTGMLARAVQVVGGRAVTEASGGVRPGNARAIAATGVDVISSGWVTHSAPALDVSMEIA